MRKTINLVLLPAIILMCQSCKHAKYVYLQDMPLDSTLPITNKQEAHVMPGDRLEIHVICTKQELAIPFNAYSYQVSQEGGASSSNDAVVRGYLVDDEGFIDFPILGRLQVGGLTTRQISSHIQELLVNGKYIPDALVDARITNFTIYGLGALAPGKLVIPDAKINVLQAVAQMGDLRGTAKYDKVRVIRENGNERMEYDIDMTTKELYNSPAFHLQQNDIVYAEPKKLQKDAANRSAIWVSLVAALASIAYTLTYILK